MLTLHIYTTALFIQSCQEFYTRTGYVVIISDVFNECVINCVQLSVTTIARLQKSAKKNELFIVAFVTELRVQLFVSGIIFLDACLAICNYL